MTGKLSCKEALKRTFAGNRRWNKEAIDSAGVPLSFVKHMMGAMKSIASHWKASFDRREGSVEWHHGSIRSDLPETDPLSVASSRDPDPERIAIAKDRIEKIEAFFADDTLVSLILFDGLGQEKKGPEIQADGGFTPKEYNAALRRARRALEKEGL